MAITSKSFVLGGDGITYFEVIRITDDNGSYTETANLIGPASALAADQADKIENRANSLAQSAYVVSYTNKRILEEKDTSDAILSITGVSPLKVIQDRYLLTLTETGWTIDEGVGFIPLAFSLNAQQVLKYSVNGGSTKNAEIYGDIIRLKNYPTSGIDTDFFHAEDRKRYISLPNRNIVIKKP